MEYSVERYQREGQLLPAKYGRQYGQPALYQEPLMPYRRQTSYPPRPLSALVYNEDQGRGNYKTYQNHYAINTYNSAENGKIREGTHASAVTQLHQNDLHNLKTTKELPVSRLNGGVNGYAVAKTNKNKQYIKQQLHLQSKFSKEQSDRTSSRKQDSELMTSSFDPMKDRHMWAMWRTAVNGRIVDEVRYLEKVKTERPPTPSSTSEPIAPGMYGKALVIPPLKRFIKVNEESKEVAMQMANPGRGTLETSQFVYYGLPRVNVSYMK